METSQQLVIGWFEYAVAGTALLLVTKLIVSRLRQPIDRQNLILMGWTASAFLPLVVGFSSAPSWHLGLVATDKDQVAVAQVASTTKQFHPEQFSAFAATEPNTANFFQDQFAANRIADQQREQRPNAEQVRLTTDLPATSASDVFPASSLIAVNSDETNSRNTFSVWWFAVAILILSHALAFGFFIIEKLVGTIRLRNICRAAQSPDASVKETWTQISGERGASVRLLLSTQITAPLVFGFWRPVILIPEPLAQVDRSALRFCLAHEWSHVIGGDLRAWQFANFCQYLLWYQPLFWMLRRELRICQDLVADDRAVGTSGEVENRLQYSELLMSIAKQKLNPNIVGAIAFHDRSSQLSRRIKMLLSSSQSLRVRSPQAFLWVSGCLLLIASVLVGSIRLNTANAEAGLTQQPKLAQDGDTQQATDNQKQSEQSKDFKIVRGRVINEKGEPVPGAQLWLPLQFDSPLVIKTASDNDGNFELNCPIDWVDLQDWKKQTTVWAYAPGYNIQLVNAYKSLRLDMDEHYTMVLPPESEARFRVLRPDGNPMSGLLVHARSYRGVHQTPYIPDELRAIVSATTDDDGYATLRAVRQELIDSLEMVCEDFGHQEFGLSRNIEERPSEIRLRDTAAIKGKFSAENPAWAAGIKLVFTTSVREEWRNTRGHAEVITDADGRFEVPKIAFGASVNVTVHIDPELPVRPILPSEIQLEAGEVKQLEIPLAAAPLVRGKVVSKNNVPVPNVYLSLSYGNGQYDQATTDQDGRFAARSLPGEVRVDLISLPEGHGRPVHSADVKPHEIAANVSEFEVPTIQLVGTYDIVGLLLDENNQPMADKIVDALDRGRRYSVGISDSEGRFIVTVPDGVQSIVKLGVMVDNISPSSIGKNLEVIQRDPLVVRYITNNRDAEMQAARQTKPDVILTGQVLYQGKPIAGVPILMERTIPVFNPDGTVATSLSRTGPGDELETDAEGKYRLKGLKAGDQYRIYIRPKFAAVDLDWQHYYQTVPEDADGDVALPDVNMQPLSQTIAGIVVDPDGNPVQDATVMAQMRGGKRITILWMLAESKPIATSDEQGHFQIKELPEIPLSIYAYIKDPKAGYARFPVKFDIERNQQDIRIVLDPSLIDDKE